MDPRRMRATLAIGLSAVLLAAGVVVSAAAPGGGKPKCTGRMATCTSVTTTSSTTSSTSSTSTSTTTAPDTTPPVASIASPTDGTDVSAQITVTGSSTDDRQVSRVELRVDSGTWTAASGTASWSKAVDTAAWAAGSTHTVNARAIDGAGNASAIAGVTVHKAASAPAPGAGDPSVAPTTQGTWVSPEGATIEVTSAGPWSIREVYRLLLENSAAPGDFAEVAPNIVVRVQDTVATQTTTSTRSSGGVYTKFSATIYLKGVSSNFSSEPDSLMAHEYGHAWTLYHLYMSQSGSWGAFLDARWSNADGSLRLADDSRLDSSYVWDRAEIIADDYRLLFGSAAAVSQDPTHMNPSIPAPGAVAGLRQMLATGWS